MKIIDISRVLSNETPVYPGDEKPIFKKVNTIEKDKYNRTFFSASAHNGTHVDAPNHFINGAKAIHELDLSVFYGKCSVVEFSGVISDVQIAKLLTNCHERLLFKGENELSEDAAILIANSHIRLVGVESLSVGNFNHPLPVHIILLEKGVIPLEALDLSKVTAGEYILSAFPLNLFDSDGSPVRAVLIEN